MLLVPACCAVLVILYAAGMRTPLFIFITSVLVFLVSTFLSLIYYISSQITGDGITEATLFHLLYGLDGFDLTNFFGYVTLVLAVGAGAVITCRFAWKMCRRPSQPVFAYRLSRIVHLTVIGALSGFAVGVHPATLQTVELLKEFYDDRYTSLLNTELKIFDTEKENKKAKSLVYIYGESFERTYLNNEAFPELTPHLSALEHSSLSIHGIGQSPLSEWTISGMVASQCGLPLSTFKPNRNDFSNTSAFIPGATCIGDFLRSRGYELAYIGGADSAFAGKGRFYLQHQFGDVVGLKEFKDRYGPDVPVSKWGVYDDMLLDAALEKFRQLSKIGKPFALYLLTADTHPPRGHATPACAGNSKLKYGDGSNAMLNAVKCGDRLISRFVERIEAEAGDGVVIVIASDHLQMQSDATELLSNGPRERDNMFIVRTRDIEPKQLTRQATTMDIAPTILSVLGWDIEAMALGRNLLGEEQTLVEKYGQEKFYEMVKAWRMSLWKVWRNDSSASASGKRS